MMKNRIQKWGNSLAIRIPRSFAAALGWGEDTPVAISLDDGALVVKTDEERAWVLEALLADVTGENVHPAIGPEGGDRGDKGAEERRQAGGGGG